MPAPLTRLLCVGDIHLGRRPSRVPDLSDHGVNSGDLTPVAAWRRVVDIAIEQRVAAVVLAGDVVEADNQFFEAYGPLQAGVQRLVAAGIPVVAVAGNHDVQVLPRLADEIPGFKLLGRGGVWEQHVIAVGGVPIVRLLGWSFPQKVVTSSPLDTVPAPADDLPTVGVLHCDLDVRDSRYAPVTTAALAAAPGDAWLLGHIHAPSAREGRAPRGYLGSLCSLDPGETGTHGAWLLDVNGVHDVAISRLYISPLRWEPVDVDIADLGHPDDLEGAVAGAVQAVAARIADTVGETRAVGCRVRLVGASSLHRAIVASLDRKDPTKLRALIGACVYFVESVVDDARQAIDLAVVAQGTDPPGLLARMLREIEANTEAGERLVRDAARALAVTAHLSPFAPLPDVADMNAVARKHLLRQGLLALEGLMAQRVAP